ncbi:hypothetical protein H2200_012625 [Cladophialophora chaetospira]|uniref:Ams2/SPT21 N-terminal domain-containing protein n=1 Tax=Cladophialophora chaetospira TaxID=386627 RepID=A0AA38WX96_9EURO|nr:hypothetical protein H2200_012625 [Cladophialophora chaetospira]
MATSPAEGVLIRTIRLKVLYTFDSEQKDNHLARWPQPLEVQTAYIDDTSQIGVIDLRTCLEAVTTASPELTTSTENDYTIYAYDYSEPDTPLVGQGMLSKAFNAQSLDNGGDGEIMVTGRITKNVMGLFSKNAQETLEVKLRLTPVNTFGQARNRSGSVCSQDGGRPQWNTSTSSQSFQRSASPIDTTGLETMQRMLSGENAGTGSRPATPTATQTFNPAARGQQSRPGSRAGMRQPSHGRRDSFNSGYYSGDEVVEEGPARKRAKTTKVDWPSKSNLNIERQPDSLRVAASTASSVRLHRPVAVNPIAALQAGAQGEEPVRPPTPIPATKTGKPRGRPRKQREPSNLARGRQVRDSSPAPSVAGQSEFLSVPVESPEDTRARSVDSTPANLPSSPPVMPDLPHPAITSPALPPMMNTGHDSGFMSGNLDDMFGDDQLLQFEDFILDKPEDQGGDMPGQELQFSVEDEKYPPVFEEGNDIDEEQVTRSVYNTMPPPLLVTSKALTRAQSYTQPPAPRVDISSPRLAPAPTPRARQLQDEQREQLRKLAPAPNVPNSDPAPRTLQRAQTWAPDSDVPMSDALTGEETKTKTSKKKVGKELTKARLETAIANGQMPPFCDNCGAIETPAWRRAFAKVFESGWDEVETSLGVGECCFKEPLERNDDGSVKKFRGFKVEKKAADGDDWVAITLCNPCGLWFHKQKCPRPPAKWQKKDPNAKRKRKRNPPKSSAKVNGDPHPKTDDQSPASDDSSPADSATEVPDGEDNDADLQPAANSIADDGEPQLPPMPQSFRANSADRGPRGLPRTRHQMSGRQVQSSPTRGPGSEGVPIELDLTPKPVRRQLFPSPDKIRVCSDPGPQMEAQKSDARLPAFVRRSPRLNKTRDVFAIPAAAVEVAVDGKENVAPTPAVVDDGLADLFEEGPDEVELPPPTTPTPKRRSERILLKTPSKTPQRQFGAQLSPNAERLPIFRTPKYKQDQHPALAALLGSVQKDILEMTPITRSIHDALTSDQPMGMDFHNDHMILRSGGRKETPKKSISFDFPDLPSLKNSSPFSGDNHLNFGFSELTTDQLTSDMIDPFANSAMPSSPPGGLFGYLDSAEMEESVNAMWDKMIDPSGGQSIEESAYPDPEGLTVAETASHALRRSPRRQKAK